MNDQIRQIAQRLAGLREVVDATPADFAQAAGISEAEYADIESGTRDIPVSVLHNIGQKYKIDLSTLMFGNEPHVSSYSVTRKGKGAIVERSKAYKYQALGAGFIDRKADPFIVTVEPKPEDTPIFLNAHMGQEFNLIIEGRMLLHINGNELIMDEGDSIFFDAQCPHGMKAMDGKKVKFLAIII
jgi:mannose-6-phosphate isomerase-like protein (cupin superfamily)/DNA-binding XRE family transcriptional regulator